jgi:hypothetical protein
VNERKDESERDNERREWAGMGRDGPGQARLVEPDLLGQAIGLVQLTCLVYILFLEKNLSTVKHPPINNI